MIHTTARALARWPLSGMALVATLDSGIYSCLNLPATGAGGTTLTADNGSSLITRALPHAHHTEAVHLCTLGTDHFPTCVHTCIAHASGGSAALLALSQLGHLVRNGDVHVGAPCS